MDSIRILVNGQSRNVRPGTKLLELIESLGVKPATVAAQHNEQIVDRESLAFVTLADGDVVELIRIVGGG